MNKAIEKPNYTQIPNALLGDLKRGNITTPGLMASLEGSQLKVLLAVCRLTFGYHQDTRRASLKTIQEFTGLSRQGVINAANRLEEMNLIQRSFDGGVTLWQVIVNSVDQELCQNEVNSVDQVVNSVDQTSQLSRPPSKKETRNKPKKENNIQQQSDFGEICKMYEAEIGGLSPLIADQIKDDLETYPVEWIKRAIARAVELNKRNWGYVRGILKNWHRIGGPQNDKPKVSTNGHNTHSGKQDNLSPDLRASLARIAAAGGR